MKFRCVYTLFLFLITLGVAGQDDTLDDLTITEFDVPEAVTDNQGFYFPGSLVTDWQMESTADEDYYIANFSHSGTDDKVAIYKKGGDRVAYSKFLVEGSLPTPIRLKVQSTYQDFTIERVKLITLFNPEIQLYQVHMRNEALVQNLFYDTLGNVISKLALPEILVAKLKRED